MIENFIKVTKDFTKLKDTLTNYAWEKSHFKKPKEWNFPWFPGFTICYMVKNENPETLQIDRKLSKSIKQLVLTVYRYKKTAKKQSIYYLSTILALITTKVTFKQY